MPDLVPIQNGPEIIFEQPRKIADRYQLGQRNSPPHASTCLMKKQNLPWAKQSFTAWAVALLHPCCVVHSQSQSVSAVSFPAFSAPIHHVAWFYPTDCGCLTVSIRTRFQSIPPTKAMSRELSMIELNPVVADPQPADLCAVQPLGIKANSKPAPPDNLDPVRVFWRGRHKRAVERIRAGIAHQCLEAVGTFLRSTG
ncbi:hypothetical protein NKJ94_35005 [Mesorhizobium sp. M0060]